MRVAESKVHGDKLRALLSNGKLPAADRVTVQQAVERYDQWVAALDRVEGTAERFSRSW